MNYTEALEYIENIGSWLGSRPGLSRITELCAMLGDPQDGMKFVHVAGTNGKGSFCAMTASVLRAAGYRTGLYVSPYVKRFNEQISVDGECISDDELARIITRLRAYADRMADQPTEFELKTAAAFEFFRQRACQVVVLEVGMGGRLDSTNIIKEPVLSVITGIALDHTAYLGDTIEKIAAEKSGIIKPGCPVHWGGKDASAGSVIKRYAAQNDSPCHAVDYSALTNVRCSLGGCDFDYGGLRDLHINLLGMFQPENAASVVSAVPLLRERGFDISEEALRRGLASTVWQARFELLSATPVVIYDGSHNPQGMTAAVGSIQTLFGDKSVNILTGVMRDKDYNTMSELISRVARRVFTVTPAMTRSLPAREYAEVFRLLGVESEAYDSLAGGVAAAYADSVKHGIPLVALGSLYMYADFITALEAIRK